MYPLDEFRFDARGREIIEGANLLVDEEPATKRAIRPVDLLDALVHALFEQHAPDSHAAGAFELARVDTDEVFHGTSARLSRGEGGKVPDHPLKPAAGRLLANAREAAHARGDALITPEYLLMALLRDADGPRMAGRAFTRTNGGPMVPEQVLGTLIELMGPHPLGRDLTAEALAPGNAPIVAREAEVRRILEILARRTRNNPIVIGDSGTGKVPIVAAVAAAIADRTAPPVLHGKPLFLVEWRRVTDPLDLFRRAGVAGAILCISDADWFLNLRTRDPHDPVLSAFWTLVVSGELRVILTLRPGDADSLVAPGATLDNHFQLVAVPEATVEQTARILRARRTVHEDHHRITVPDELIPVVADLADRYVPRRALPAKATDLLDEAGARVRMRDTRAEHVELTRADVLDAVAALSGVPVDEIDREPGSGATTLRPGLETRLPRPDESVAILVGSASYEDPRLPEIPAVSANLTELRRRFDGVFGRVRTFADPPLSDLRAIVAAAKEATDTVLFYFAGHGLRQPDGSLYLALPGTDHEQQRFTSLAYADIRAMLAESPALRKLVILDCCYSGVATETMGDPVPGAELEIEGTHILTAASSTRLAHAPGTSRHTGFTGALLDVLREGVDNGHRLIRVADLYAPLRRRLITDGLPEPRQLGTDTIGHLAIAHNPFGR
ncbi:hypothetical protein Afil01_10810 [Actinorhabdospora filicis]|uniref:Uncharacterized protein n=1 Tax=Actinorhabdospora filicis TaxID=1785913 RepID=A0A9W6SFM3_9ACTN|nr:caspase family protein [Actinorhabdospora filicis]GLZ76274.1 hypothetical protein Afil01_10810 [Actinorhabdospora filicis]